MNGTRKLLWFWALYGLFATSFPGCVRLAPLGQDAISDLAVQKHKPSCMALRTLTWLAGDTPGQFGFAKRLHQLFRNALNHFARCRIAESSSLVQ